MPKTLDQMSDEEFLTQELPTISEADKQQVEDTSAVDDSTTQSDVVVEDEVATEPAVTDETAEAAEKAAAEADPDPSDEDIEKAAGAVDTTVGGTDKTTVPAKDQPAKTAEKNADGSDKVVTDKKTDATTEGQEAPITPEQHKTFYESIIGKPIRANGKDIVLRTPEEAIRLIQAGAGANKKIQDLHSHLKTVRKLEKAGVKDADLDLLLDVHAKNPEAIKKVLKDSGIDPLDVNTDEPVNYVPGNHSVSDAEVHFQQALNDVILEPLGPETLTLIKTTWDAESKKTLTERPDILEHIRSHRQAGYYDQVTKEVERQRSIGTIPASTSFIHAYNQVFNAMAAKTQPVQQTAPVVQAGPTVLETRTAVEKPDPVAAKVAAAATGKTTPKPAITKENPLDMDDEAFNKKYTRL